MSENKTHWKVLSDSPYLGAYSLQPGQELQLTIAKAGAEQVTSADGSKETCRVIHFKEKGVKPMIVNATNAKTIAKLAGSPYLEDWPGTMVQVYAEKVRAFGETVEALRIRNFRPKKKETPICSECGKPVTAAYGKTAQAMADYTLEKYQKCLCADCAMKRAGQPTEGEAQAE